MALPRSLIGAGIGAGVGALGGAGVGAATAKDSDSRKSRALKGALAGGALGGLTGGVIHGGMRTRDLLRGGHIADPELLNAATRGLDGDHARARGRLVNRASAFAEGFGGSRSVKDIAKSDPFFGTSSAKGLKDAYKAQARKLHPDKPGGSAEAFKAMKDRYDAHMRYRDFPKTASAVFWDAFYDEFMKLGAKDPTKLKVPKPGTNLKGFERYTANPGATPITAPGKATGSAATTSGLRHSTEVGRSGTSANPTPPPTPVTP